jgi:hypothetical protein
VFVGGIFAIGAAVLITIGGAGACWDSATRRGRSGPGWAAVAMAVGALAFAFGARLLYDLEDTASTLAIWMSLVAVPALPVVALGGLAYLVYALPPVLPRLGGRLRVFRMSGGGRDGYDAELVFGEVEIEIAPVAPVAPERFAYREIEAAEVDGECLRLTLSSGRILLRPSGADPDARTRLARALVRRIGERRSPSPAPLRRPPTGPATG